MSEKCHKPHLINHAVYPSALRKIIAYTLAPSQNPRFTFPGKLSQDCCNVPSGEASNASKQAYPLCASSNKHSLPWGACGGRKGEAVQAATVGTTR